MFHKLIPPTHRFMQKCRNTYPGITQMSPDGCDRFAVGPCLWVVGRKSRHIYDVGIQYFFHLHLFNTNSFCCLDTWSNPSWLLNILWDYFRIPRNSCLLFCDAGKVLGPVYCSLLTAWVDWLVLVAPQHLRNEKLSASGPAQSFTKPDQREKYALS